MAIIVEDDPKAHFSIATTPRCRGGRYSFPCIASFYRWYVPNNTEFQARRYLVPFLSLWYDSIWDWTPVSRPISEHSSPMMHVCACVLAILYEHPTMHLYHSSLLAGLLCCIKCPNTADVNKSLHWTFMSRSPWENVTD